MNRLVLTSGRHHNPGNSSYAILMPKLSHILYLILERRSLPVAFVHRDSLPPEMHFPGHYSYSCGVYQIFTNLTRVLTF